MNRRSLRSPRGPWAGEIRRPGAVLCTLALSAFLVVMLGVTPAWSAPTGPAELAAAPNACALTSAECAEELLEEELEEQEEEAEERALEAERKSGATKDAEEEAAEEAEEEAAGGGAGANSNSPGAGSATFTLGVRVRTPTHRLPSRQPDTAITVKTSVSAEVRILLKSPGTASRLYKGETKDRDYVVRVAWQCGERPKRYAYRVVAYRDGESTGAGHGKVRRGTFTLNTHSVCARVF